MWGLGNPALAAEKLSLVLNETFKYFVAKQAHLLPRS
jgi:hypothetical protein